MDQAPQPGICGRCSSATASTKRPPSAWCCVDEDLKPLSAAGGRIPGVRFHVWIYNKRPDVKAIVHTHAPHASALACYGQPLKTIHMDSAMLHGTAHLPEWPGVPVADDEGRIISGALGNGEDHPARQPRPARRRRERRGGDLSGGVLRARGAHAAARHGRGRVQGSETRAGRRSARLPAAAFYRARDFRLLGCAAVGDGAAVRRSRPAPHTSPAPRTAARFGSFAFPPRSCEAESIHIQSLARASMRMRSPFFTSASAPPAAASGDT